MQESAVDAAGAAQVAPEKPRARASLVGSLAAMTDFALFALTNLAVTTVLGRYMSPASYGVFAGAFASYLVLLQAHSSVLSEPMLVLTSQRFADRDTPYLRSLLRLHVGLSVALCAVCGALMGVAWLLDAPAVADAALGIAISAPALTLMQFLRRVCYGRFQVVRAALGGAIYLMGVMAALALLHRTQALSVRSAFLCMGAVSLVVSWAWLVGFGVARTLGDEHVPLRETWDAHWRYAAWGTLTALLAWVPWNAWFLLLPALAGERGLHAAAELRAVFNLVQPMLQVNAALGTTLLPILAARSGSAGKRTLIRWLLVLCGASALYAPVMILLGPWAMQVLYGGRYVVDAATLWWLAPVPTAFALFIVLKGWALARGEPRRVFVASLVSGLASASVGVWLCMRGTVADAALAILIAFGLQGIALVLLVAGAEPRTQESVA